MKLITAMQEEFDKRYSSLDDNTKEAAYREGFVDRCNELGVNPRELVKLAQSVTQQDLASLRTKRPEFKGMPFAGAYRDERLSDIFRNRPPSGKLIPVYRGAHQSTVGERAAGGLTTAVVGGYNSALPTNASPTAYRQPRRNPKTRYYERGFLGRKRATPPLSDVTEWKQ